MSSAVPDLGLTAKPTSALLWRAAPVHRCCAMHAQCLTPQCQSQFQMLESSAAAALWRAVPARASSNQCALVKRKVLHCCCGGAPLTFPLCTLKKIERQRKSRLWKEFLEPEAVFIGRGFVTDQLCLQCCT